jgi:hypothetical protein
MYALVYIFVDFYRTLGIFKEKSGQPVCRAPELISRVVGTFRRWRNKAGYIFTTFSSFKDRPKCNSQGKGRPRCGPFSSSPEKKDVLISVARWFT